MSTPPKKQFDLDHLRVDERLQNAHVATFNRRALAFAIDWGLIYLATRYVGALVLILVAYLVLTKRFGGTVRQANRLLGSSLDGLDATLASYDLEARLRHQLRGVLQASVYGLMLLLIAVPVFGLGVLLLDAFAHPYIHHITDQWRTANNIDVVAPWKDLDSAVGIMTKFLGAIGYFTIFPHKWNGQTPGKRLMRIRAVRLNGQPLTFYNWFERASGYASSASMLLLGFFQYFWDRNHQTTHDKLVETVVIEQDLPLVETTQQAALRALVERAQSAGEEN
ncbi:MAG: RDD family protein [Bernardetiaceae bacterium]|jgi:uncharacterized RDD family membrane protein YckC|nr:RDD family protein [Bernardetiaceae bacterium]